MKKIYFLLFLLLSLNGCSFAPLAGPIVSGIMLYQDGKAIKYYNNHSTTLKEPIKRTCEKLGMKIFKENKDTIRAETENSVISIKVQEIQPKVTRITMRVNVFGDKPFCELFFKKLDEELNTIIFD